MLGHDKNIWIASTNIEAAEEQGDPKSQLILGWHYYIGHGVAQDKSVAAKWYEKAAKTGLPEAERLLELVRIARDKPMVADLVIGGQPASSMWKLASRVFILMVTLAAVVSISYYYWLKNQQPVVEPENRLRTSEQNIQIENEPNLHADKSITSTKPNELSDTMLVKPVSNEPAIHTVELKPIVDTTGQETTVDNNSPGKDPNSIPSPQSKSKIEELTELAEKWLEEPLNSRD